ncbi:TetR/AcrR family transcriptional regulator [Mycoplasmatota bacterium]|nr:TetR/AcrR family transcriptional regulator [Mycoplasmatota bacterium]
MRDTKKKIMNASMKLFEKKGYLETTTIEIANLAGVAEVTLFRNFKSKKDLFEDSLRYHLSVQMNENIINQMIQLPTEDFYRNLLKNRIQVALRKKKLLRLIINESFSDHLPSDLKFTDIIYKHLKDVITKHENYHQLKVSSEKNARMIAGILLSVVFIPGFVKESIDDLINDYSKLFI